MWGWCDMRMTWQWCAHNCCANVMACSKLCKWLTLNISWTHQSLAHHCHNSEPMTDVFMTCSKFWKWLIWQWWTNDWCVHDMLCWQVCSHSDFDDMSTNVAFPGFQLCSTQYVDNYVTRVSLYVDWYRHPSLHCIEKKERFALVYTYLE